MSEHSLTVADFIAAADDVDPSDVPLESQARINDALGELTTASSPGSGPDGETLVVDAAGTGDYESIAAAVDAAEAGDTIQVSSGTYTEDVLVDTDHVTIVGGESPGDVTIQSTGTGYQGEGDPVAPLEVAAEYVDVERVTVSAAEGEGYGYGVQVSGVSGASDVTLDGVHVDGATGHNTGEFGTGIRVRGAPNTVLTDVVVDGGSDVDYGIRAQEPGTTIVDSEVNHCNRCIDVQEGGNLIQDNVVNGITEESPGGFYKDPFDDGLEDDEFPSGKGIRVGTTPSGANNTVKGNEINDCAPGIEAFGSNTELRDNDLTGCSTGITVANGASNYLIADNEISDGSGRGISVFAGSSDAHQIEGNTVSNHASGIVLSGADDTTLTGNTLTENTYNGIWLNDGAGSPTGNTIEDNTVSDNGFAPDSAYPGVYLGAATDTTLESNDVGGNAAQGIYAYDSTGTVVESNTVENNGAGLEDSGTVYSGVLLWTVTDSTVTNNTIADNYYRGIWVENYTDPLTVSGNSITLRNSAYEKIVTNAA